MPYIPPEWTTLIAELCEALANPHKVVSVVDDPDNPNVRYHILTKGDYGKEVERMFCSFDRHSDKAILDAMKSITDLHMYHLTAGRCTSVGRPKQAPGPMPESIRVCYPGEAVSTYIGGPNVDIISWVIEGDADGSYSGTITTAKKVYAFAGACAYQVIYPRTEPREWATLDGDGNRRA